MNPNNKWIFSKTEIIHDCFDAIRKMLQHYSPSAIIWKLKFMIATKIDLIRNVISIILQHFSSSAVTFWWQAYTGFQTGVKGSGAPSHGVSGHPKSIYLWTRSFSFQQSHNQGVIHFSSGDIGPWNIFLNVCFWKPYGRQRATRKHYKFWIILMNANNTVTRTFNKCFFLVDPSMFCFLIFF